jgi:hypothetical protein
LETSLKLLDALIMPVLTYCSEIWGHQLIKEPNNCVELLHTKFKIIGLSRTRVANVATKAELGRLPIANRIIPKILKYYSHLNNSNNVILKQALNWQKDALSTISNPRQNKSDENNWVVGSFKWVVG